EPNTVHKALTLSHLLVDLDEPEAALSLIDSAVQTLPQLPALHARHGQILIWLMRQQEAIASFDRAIELDPNFTSALIDRGTALAELGQFDAAISNYDRAIDTGRELPGTLIELVGFKKFRGPDRHLALIERLEKDAGQMSLDDQSHFHFAA